MTTTDESPRTKKELAAYLNMQLARFAFRLVHLDHMPDGWKLFTGRIWPIDRLMLPLAPKPGFQITLRFKNGTTAPSYIDPDDRGRLPFFDIRGYSEKVFVRAAIRTAQANHQKLVPSDHDPREQPRNYDDFGAYVGPPIPATDEIAAQLEALDAEFQKRCNMTARERAIYDRALPVIRGAD